MRFECNSFVCFCQNTKSEDQVLGGHHKLEKAVLRFNGMFTSVLSFL